jgi:hypothetical protein
MALLAGVALSAAAGVASAQTPDTTPSVVAVGEAVVRRAPDRAFVSATTETRAKTPRDAQAQNAEAMTAVQARLRAASLAKDAIRTLSYGVEPEYDFINGRRQLRGYRAYNTIEVRVDDPNRLGEIVDLIGASGGTSVGNVRFDLKDRAAAERQALTEAVADAKARAEAAAAGAGRAIGQVVRIVDDGAPSPGPRPMMLGRAAGVAGSPETPIVSGDIEIRARVTLTATLK